MWPSTAPWDPLGSQFEFCLEPLASTQLGLGLFSAWLCLCQYCGVDISMYLPTPVAGPCTCTDPTTRCIMAAVSGFIPSQDWSSCSVDDLQAGFNIYGLGSCLSNEPTMTVGDPVCGNGIREAGEVCDCGSPQVRFQGFHHSNLAVTVKKGYKTQ